MFMDKDQGVKNSWADLFPDSIGKADLNSSTVPTWLRTIFTQRFSVYTCVKYKQTKGNTDVH